MARSNRVATLHRSRWWRHRLVATLALLCAACPGLPPPRISGVRTTAIATDIAGRAGRVDLLGRGFLVRGDAQDPEFGYYLYLVFQIGATLEDRVSASQAFLELTRAGDQLVDGAQRNQIALLVAPIARAFEPASAEDLLGSYDQARADVLTARVSAAGVGLDRVAIVAYPTPITSVSVLDRTRLLVGDACGDRATVRAKLQVIHERLQRGEFDTSQTLVLRVLGAFSALGNLVTQGTLSACRDESRPRVFREDPNFSPLALTFPGTPSIPQK